MHTMKAWHVIFASNCVELRKYSLLWPWNQWNRFIFRPVRLILELHGRNSTICMLMCTPTYTGYRFINNCNLYSGQPRTCFSNKRAYCITVQTLVENQPNFRTFFDCKQWRNLYQEKRTDGCVGLFFKKKKKKKE